MNYEYDVIKYNDDGWVMSFGVNFKYIIIVTLKVGLNILNCKSRAKAK